MPAAFIFEELTLFQTSSLASVYELYCRNFPLPEEQESFENFRHCMELNDDLDVQRQYGPYHELYLTIRRYDEQAAVYDEIDGGLIFGICTSPQHVANGYLCSVQVIYLFRVKSEALRRFLYADKAALQDEIEKRARAVCDMDRFRQVLGDVRTGRIAMFFEANNPDLMSPEEKQTDRDLSHVHPALRYTMWINNHTRPLEFRYVQPPLSRDQVPARYLDLFAVTSVPADLDSGTRLSVDPDGRPGVPGAVLAAHLMRFFCVSVLKGNAEAIAEPCLPSPLMRPDEPANDAALRDVADYCRAIAESGFVPLVAENSPRLRNIKLQARDLSVTVARESVRQVDEAWLTRLFRRALPHVRHWMELFAPAVAMVFLCLAAIDWILTHFPQRWLLSVPVPLFEILVRPAEYLAEYLEYTLGVSLFVIFIGLSLRGRRKRRERRQADQSPVALQGSLHAIMLNDPAYKQTPMVVLLRDILSDRAANQLTATGLLEGIESDRQSGELRALSRFLASRTLTPFLADLRLSGFNREVEREATRIETALRLFPAGAMQTMSRLTPWQAYYTCVFPVLHRVLEDKSTYVQLNDFDRWIDVDVAEMLTLDEEQREGRFTAYHEAGGEVCLFVSHILDLPWDEADPGMPLEALRSSASQSTTRVPTMLERQLAPYWNADAEFVCARMLAVIMHLASVMGRMARNRQITTDGYCRCTVLMNVTAEPSIQFLRSLGFHELPRPETDVEAAPGASLEGTLLIGTIEPGTFASVLAKGGGAAVAFFGLINEVARSIRGGGS